jgi:hypothetical protein
MMLALWLTLRCRLRCCSGTVVSGIHDGEVWVGWRCHRCGRVRHYAPMARRPP